MAELILRLQKAAMEGDSSGVRDLIAQGVDVAHQDCEGASALMLAAENGHLEVVKELLEAGAPWNAQDSEGYCAGTRPSLVPS
jgi:type IV protein arginine methyltransferase